MEKNKIDQYFHQFHAQLCRYVEKMTKDGATSQDVVQKTFIALYNFKGQINEKAIKSWLYRTAFRFALDEKRKKTEEYKDNFQGASDPLDILIQEETEDILRVLIDKLPPQQKQIIKMKFYDNKTFNEISKQLKVPIGTALSRDRLAKQKIKCDMLPHGKLLRFG